MKRILGAVAILATAFGIATASAAAAGASVAPSVVGPTTTYSDQGVAGYYAAPNAWRISNGDSLTGVHTTFWLRNQAENVTVANGVELCRAQSLSAPVTAAAVLYTQWNPGTDMFDVYAGHSLSTNCLAALGGVSGAHVIDSIPAGHSVYLAITVDASHVVHFTDSDQTTDTGATSTFGGWTFGFDRAGIGTNGENGVLTTPATNLDATFRQSQVRDSDAGWVNINRKGLTRIVLNKVVDTVTGTSAGGVLITPATLKAAGFQVYLGQFSNI